MVDFTTLPCFRLILVDLDCEVVAALPFESEVVVVEEESDATLLP